MVGFTRYDNALYLPTADIGNVAQARIGFLFQDSARTDQTFELNQASWTDPAQQGFFFFFLPSAVRDWSQFAAKVRTLFGQTAQSQFAWIVEQGSGSNVTLSAATLIQVNNQGTASPSPSAAFTFAFATNIALNVPTSPFLPSVISFDDASGQFLFPSNSASAINLTAQPPNGAQQTFATTSAALALSMNGGGDPNGGSVSADFALAVADLAAFEAGLMYFNPGTAGLLGAYSFPALRAPGGAATPLQFSGWFDVLSPLDDLRSYLLCTDGLLGSYFTTANGKAIALTTTAAGADLSTASRLVFANRPVQATSDTSTYYLTLAGTFGLGIDGGDTSSDPALMLCGTAGTEFLSVSVEAGAFDSLVFSPGNPAFQKTTPPATPGAPPQFLDSMGGQVTTAWAQLQTSSGGYVSQPQDSPLYHQSGTTSASAANADASLSVYLLDFLALQSWSAVHAAPQSAVGTVQSSPMVPLVPFAGLSFNTADEAAPFLLIEATALNPTRKNEFSVAAATVSASRRARGLSLAPSALDDLHYAMTPPGLLAGLSGTGNDQLWEATRIAISPPLVAGNDPIYLQFTAMEDQIRAALQQNQIFLVISTLTNPNPPKNTLFAFAGTDQQLNIADWPFSLSPTGTAASDGTPPIVMMKFYPGQSLKDLIADTSLWSQADTFNGPTFKAEDAQTYVTKLIEDAAASVDKDGTSSLYYNFYQVVTDPNWSGLLAVNANMQLNDLPTAIKAVTGGMTYPDKDGNPVSNIDAFRVHHVGVSINDTDPGQATPTISQSSLFGLVDYEKPEASSEARLAAAQLDIFYNFEVEYLRALFTNSALSSFSCKINLTINNLFGTDVTGDPEGVAAAAGDDPNIVVITGSYQAHSTSGDDDSSGAGVYSFVSEAPFEYVFGTNPYLDTITLDKIQFSFLQETDQGGDTSNIQASFGIWGKLVFKEFEILDIFAFKDLVFNDLGISVSFDLTVPASGEPYTSNIALAFNPGNLRLDIAASEPREGDTSLLSLLPFKLTSFLYNQYPDDQTIEDLGYFALTSVPLDPGFTLSDKFNYGLTFELDLGGLGALVGSLEAFKFGFLIGWSIANGEQAGGIAFGVQMPQADGKLEIKIEGVLDLLIEQFILRYEKPDDGGPAFLVVALHNSSLTVMGVRLPPGEAQIDVALFAPIGDSEHIGWIAAYNNTAPPPAPPEAPRLPSSAGGSSSTAVAANGNGNGGEGEGSAFELVYLGLGQRTGPSKDDTPTNFADFMTFMTTDFWDAIENQEYDKVYRADGQWLALTNFKLLGMIEVGFVFYDMTPFYSLTLNVEKLFNFEITYTKVSDSIGLFYAEFTLPDSLRTYQVGAASLTLPSLGVSVYTNGNWKVDLGFPDNDDWSKSFRVEAMAGPVPVTGSGGFYIASLSSATSDVFKADYASILAFGFAARLGVGKDFTAGPLKAGVSVTFFGIIQGAVGYHIASSDEMFKKPDALMLSGQFGIIGELYGSIDFVIIKASVNVRLQASIGIVLKYEPLAGNDGSILLYIEASVSVSVSVEIGLGFFSITISFSFDASFRFDWQLAGPSQNAALLARHHNLRATRLAALAADGISTLPLLPGFTTALPLWFTPEGTAVFADTSSPGVPWVVSSLALQYDPAPPAGTTYATFMPFEKLTAQLVTWALGQATGQSGWNFSIEQTTLSSLDQHPDVLLAGIDYPALLSELAVFSAAGITVPGGTGSASAATFPMFPFLNIKTTGRQVGGAAADLNYVFATKNIVSATYISEVDAYFNQLFVNQSSDSTAMVAGVADGDATTPLVQEIFYDYLTGLIRGGVHQLLEVMQNGQMDSATIDALILASVQAGQFASLAGQMSSSFRGGARLPYTAGLTVPSGSPLTTTNPLYALLWQQFPVGGFASGNQYSISLSNPDTTQTWLSVTASWNLTSDWLTPLQGILPSAIVAPTAPVQMPFTDVGPQSFAFDNAIVWTQPAGTSTSLRPFPSSLQALQARQATAIAMLVESREGGAPYLPGGTTLAPSSFTWATQISLTVAQVPGGDGKPLPDIFALTGASEQDEQLLEQILAVLATDNVIASIQILYQTAAGSSGLTSQTVTPADVFVLRTNSTTVSAPPTMAVMGFGAAPPTVPVGAQIDETEPFLEIVQQAVVTNATGYYLRYLDSSNNSLPTTLFTSGPAPLTILISYVPDGTLNTPASPSSVQPYYNAIAIDDANAALIYYVETTDPALNTQYSTVAAGSIGVLMTRDDSVMKIAPSANLRASASVEHGRLYRRSELVSALVEAGVDSEADLHAILAEAGSGAAQLNALYSLVTYQVTATTGFIQSNLSAPIQPQQPDGASSAADGLTDASDDTRSYRAYVPLYALASANQPLTANPNRYASIADPVSMAFFQIDAFGNQMPGSQPFAATNYYFDPIIPVDQWQGIVSSYDFNTASGPQANSLTVYLQPSQTAFDGLSADQLASALQGWTNVQDQITGPGISFVIETNLALQSDGSMVEVTLSAAQSAAIVAMVGNMVAWLQNGGAFPSAVVPLTVAVTGPGTIPPIFEMFVKLGVERDPALISPLLKDQHGNITFPSAQFVSTTIASTVGSSKADGSASVDINAFAGQFVTAFPSLVLSVGLGGAQQAESKAANRSKAARKARQLRAAGVAGDGSSSDQSAPQSLWAVQQILLDVSIGTGANAGPYYASPMPLDNRLNSATVPLPTLPSGIGGLGATQLFTDVDLDVYNGGFFEAVDLMLTPALAAASFEQARDAYNRIANGRTSLANLYSTKEIDWLFADDSPFTGPAEQLTMAQDAFGQQMRAALGTAYTTDTIVQFGVTWANALPAEVDGMYELFGAIRPASGASLPQGYTISAPHVAINSSGASVLTFLFGLANIAEQASVSLDLVFNITHIQHFLEPASDTPADEARPSIWLQLVDAGATPHVGPAGVQTVIPLVLREYPTPPTLISQTAVQGSGTNQAPSVNPLVAAAAWHLQYAYQAQLTPHDQIVTQVTYNTDLTVSNGGSSASLAASAGAPVQYTLFEALARFNAAYPYLQPQLSPTAQYWVEAITCFADLVDAVVNNSTWTPNPNALAGPGKLVRITDQYGVVDADAGSGNRSVTISWTGTESSFAGATVSIEALDPTSLVPYPNQSQQRLPQSVVDLYTPQPPLANDWIVHQIEIDDLNVLAAENALAAVQIERNLIEMSSGGTDWFAKPEFVYMTPLVSATQPITPFVDNATPIDVTTLPSGGSCSACTQTVPAGTASLCQYIYNIMYDLLANDESGAALTAARLAAGLDDSAPRRMKMACSFQYPASSAGGVTSANPVMPLVPIVLARSFVIDGSDLGQLGEFSALFADAITKWTSDNAIAFGGAAQAGAQLVFDLTLFAELSGLNTPVLRLRALQLKTAAVTP